MLFVLPQTLHDCGSTDRASTPLTSPVAKHSTRPAAAAPAAVPPSVSSPIQPSAGMLAVVPFSVDSVLSRARVRAFADPMSPLTTVSSPTSPTAPTASSAPLLSGRSALTLGVLMPAFEVYDGRGTQDSTVLLAEVGAPVGNGVSSKGNAGGGSAGRGKGKRHHRVAFGVGWDDTALSGPSVFARPLFDDEFDNNGRGGGGGHGGDGDKDNRDTPYMYVRLAVYHMTCCRSLSSSSTRLAWALARCPLLMPRHRVRPVVCIASFAVDCFSYCRSRPGFAASSARVRDATFKSVVDQEQELLVLMCACMRAGTRLDRVSFTSQCHASLVEAIVSADARSSSKTTDRSHAVLSSSEWGECLKAALNELHSQEKLLVEVCVFVMVL